MLSWMLQGQWALHEEHMKGRRTHPHPEVWMFLLLTLFGMVSVVVACQYIVPGVARSVHVSKMGC